MADRDLLKQQLYEQLLAKSNAGDEELNQAEDAHQLGALGSALSKSTAMIGQVGGQPNKYDDAVGSMNDSLYKGAEDKYTKQQSADEKRSKLKLDLTKALQEKSKKLTPITGVVGDNDQPAFLDDNNQVQYLPGLKTKPTAQVDKWADAPGEGVPEGYALQVSPSGEHRVVKLPSNIKSTKTKVEKPAPVVGPVEKAQIQTLGPKVANQASLVNTIESGRKLFDKAIADGDEDLAVTIGNGMIKSLNSDQGPDAVGNQEAERLTPYLNYKLGNITGPGSFVGRDLGDFSKQLDVTSRKLKDAVAKSQGQLESLSQGGKIGFDQKSGGVKVRSKVSGKTALWTKPIEQLDTSKYEVVNE